MANFLTQKCQGDNQYPSIWFHMLFMFSYFSVLIFQLQIKSYFYLAKLLLKTGTVVKTRDKVYFKSCVLSYSANFKRWGHANLFHQSTVLQRHIQVHSRDNALNWCGIIFTENQSSSHQAIQSSSNTAILSPYQPVTLSPCHFQSTRQINLGRNTF